jgi:hypothetical protein
MPHAFVQLIIIFALVLLPIQTLTAAAPIQHWSEVIRAKPYWESQGVASNLREIRHWVLRGSSFCSQQERHVLFDRRVRFIGYINNEATNDATQTAINNTRKRLAQQKRAHLWIPGTISTIGYPFALGCNQPHVNLDEAIGRVLGRVPSDRIWGTWRGVQVGSSSGPLSLVDSVMAVYQHRHKEGRLTFPESLIRYLMGQILIESGGQQHSVSSARAQGVMQLMPQVLKQCQVPAQYHVHRVAQIDCALQLVEQNHRILRPAFQTRFGNLPPKKREELYGMLLVQAYHGGLGRVRNLLNDPEIGAAGRYFAEHHQKMTASDISLGMIFHNLGRNGLGFASLYYVTDSGIAADALCEQRELKKQGWCNGK